MKCIHPPLNEEDTRKLRAGDEVKIDGTIYAARDAAHKRMIESLRKGDPLPFNPDGQIIYYVGPCPAPPGRVIGSAGPTTSGRMDAYAPDLIALGLRAMIGKGERSAEVAASMERHGAVYLATFGGAGAYLAKCIVKVETVAYPELGPEALLKMEVRDFPCLVAIDAQGNSLYQEVREKRGGR
ncbi:MAG TPA: Fe-S-containing hydro-lyase [Syntrophomonadaceae bacterium]|nr:Fe-S-containing hydro-lyase [Syntrophomonadaceae bacterium]